METTPRRIAPLDADPRFRTVTATLVMAMLVASKAKKQPLI
jgi:hypothetical protein